MSGAAPSYPSIKPTVATKVGGPSTVSCVVPPSVAVPSSPPVSVVLVNRAERRPAVFVHIVPIVSLVSSLADFAASNFAEKSAMRFRRWSRVSATATVPAGSSPSSKPSLCSGAIGAPTGSFAPRGASVVAGGYGAPTKRGSTGEVSTRVSAVSVTASATSLEAPPSAASAPAAAAIIPPPPP